VIRDTGREIDQADNVVFNNPENGPKTQIILTKEPVIDDLQQGDRFKTGQPQTAIEGTVQEN
jgi:hypothetical protein